MTDNKKKSNAAISDGRRLTEFSFSENKMMQTLLIDNQPWFVAYDVCNILELTNASESLKALDNDEKLTSEVLRSGQRRKVNLINESGLYNLIFRSNKEQARAFRKWVTAVVLPQIRQTGAYTGAKEPYTALDLRDRMFTWDEVLGVKVRAIDIDGERWYCMGDYSNAIGLFTATYQIAQKLNKHRIMARKIWLFGMTHAGYFTTKEGLNLVTLGNRKLKHNNLPIPFPEITSVNQITKGGAHE